MTVLLACLLLTAPATVVASGDDERPPLESLLPAKQRRDYREKDRYKDRMKVFRKAFEHYERRLDVQARNRQHEQLKETLAALRHLCHYAFNEPTRGERPKDLRAKKVKKLEITLRKLNQLVEDYQFKFALKTQQEFEKTSLALEELRQQLLAGIFGQPVHDDSDSEARSPRPGAGFGFLASAPASQRRGVREVVGDKFTEEEFDRIRRRQDLKGRVKVFLDIAESRLIELSRRLESGEYQPEAADEEDADRIENNRKREEKRREAEAKGAPEAENPLLFFTPAQLAHAYERAIDGITVNVDDQYKQGKVSEKDLKKVMKKINKKAPDYLEQVREFQEIARQARDEELYRELLDAQEITEVAIKGSQMFLGAPEN